MERKHLILFAILVVYTMWSLPALYLRGELLPLIGNARPGMTKQEVLQTIGEPKGVYTAEQNGYCLQRLPSQTIDPGGG